MRRTSLSPDLDADETWRYGIIGGVTSLPSTALRYWQSASELSLVPVLFGGFVAGYLCETDCRRAGVEAGLIGALPALWLVFDVLSAASNATGPTWFRVAATGFGLVSMLAFTALTFGVAAATGAVGAIAGSRLSKNVGRQQPPAADN